MYEFLYRKAIGLNEEQVVYFSKKERFNSCLTLQRRPRCSVRTFKYPHAAGPGASYVQECS